MRRGAEQHLVFEITEGENRYGQVSSIKARVEEQGVATYSAGICSYVFDFRLLYILSLCFISTRHPLTRY